MPDVDFVPYIVSSFATVPQIPTTIQDDQLEFEYRGVSSEISFKKSSSCVQTSNMPHLNAILVAPTILFLPSAFIIVIPVQR